MRVRITFKVQNRGAYVPFHHQFLISELVRGVLVKSDQDAFLDFDLFSFSALKGQTQVSRNGLHFNSNKVTLVLTSPNEEFLHVLIQSIFGQETLHVGQLIIEPEQVDIEDIGTIPIEQKFICISPLVIAEATLDSDEGKRFIEPGSDEFSDLLFEATINRMEKAGWKTEKIDHIEKFQLDPDKEYIRRLRKAQKKFARIYSLFQNDVKYEVRGYTFPFVLYASQEVLDFVFSCGLGLYCHKGFGMLDLANIDPIQRLKPYPAAIGSRT